MIWLHPAPDTDDIARAYAGKYYTHAAHRKTPGTRLKTRLKAGGLGKALGYINYLQGFRRGRLLDIGCGNGSYLSVMKGLGWEVEGVEPDSKAAALARSEVGDCIQEASFEEAQIEPDSFDVITLNHIVEHVSDPDLLLERCHECLREGGHVVLRTPNSESLGHRVFKESWQSLDVPRHLHVFSRESIVHIAEGAGFKVEKLRTVPRDAHVVFSRSKSLRRVDASAGNRRNITGVLQGVLFLLVEHLYLCVNCDCGEELALVLVK